MFEIVYDPWDGEALTDEQAFMFGPTLVRDLANHNKNEIITKTISSFLAIESTRLEIKRGNLQYPKNVIVTWKNNPITIYFDGSIVIRDKFFGDYLDLIWSELFDV